MSSIVIIVECSRIPRASRRILDRLPYVGKARPQRLPIPLRDALAAQPGQFVQRGHELASIPRRVISLDHRLAPSSLVVVVITRLQLVVRLRLGVALLEQQRNDLARRDLHVDIAGAQLLDARLDRLERRVLHVLDPRRQHAPLLEGGGHDVGVVRRAHARPFGRRHVEQKVERLVRLALVVVVVATPEEHGGAQRVQRLHLDGRGTRVRGDASQRRRRHAGQLCVWARDEGDGERLERHGGLARRCLDLDAAQEGGEQLARMRCDQ